MGGPLLFSVGHLPQAHVSKDGGCPGAGGSPRQQSTGKQENASLHRDIFEKLLQEETHTLHAALDTLALLVPSVPSRQSADETARSPLD